MKIRGKYVFTVTGTSFTFLNRFQKEKSIDNNVELIDLAYILLQILAHGDALCCEEETLWKTCSRAVAKFCGQGVFLGVVWPMNLAKSSIFYGEWESFVLSGETSE